VADVVARACLARLQQNSWGEREVREDTGRGCELKRGGRVPCASSSRGVSRQQQGAKPTGAGGVSRRVLGASPSRRRSQAATRTTGVSRQVQEEQATHQQERRVNVQAAQPSINVLSTLGCWLHTWQQHCSALLSSTVLIHTQRTQRQKNQSHA
jgi:hypothetical protein